MTIGIVTDSACDVPAQLAARLGITVVPVYINIGETSYLDGVELSRREFFDNLADYPAVPTTAAPSPGAFTETYQALADAGVTEILSLHISAELSATYQAAVLGAEDVAGAQVTHFNTRQISMGSGLLAITAAEAAAAGRSVAEIVAMLDARLAKTRIYAALGTLEFLRRSGRVNWATFGLGTLLQIKPVVTVYDSQVLIADRVRTFRRAVGRVVTLLEEARPLERVAVLYTGSAEPAEQLVEAVPDIFPFGQEPILMEIGPAIGTHAGPGAVGVAFIQV